MENVVKELETRGISVTGQKWQSVDFANYKDASARADAAATVKKEPSLSARVIIFLVMAVTFVFVLPYLVTSPPSEENVFVNILRAGVILVAALMVWSRNKLIAITGWVVTGLFAAGAAPSLLGGSNTGGIAVLAGLAIAFAVGWYGAPIFKRERIVLSDGQYVYGVHPTAWGRGAGDSSLSSIWVMGLLLNKLVVIPGLYVFHGLKSPGAKRIDAEHVVTHGNNVYVIDSWSESADTYGWQINRKGHAFASKGDGGHRHTQIANAADRYRSVLGPDINVIPVMVIVSGKATIGTERWSPRGVGLFKADELLEFIGDTAVENLDSWCDNPAVRKAVAPTVTGQTVTLL